MIPHDAALAQAVFLATAGMPILPVHGISADGRCTCGNPACASPGKHPIFRNWTKRATTNQRVIEAMDWRNHNIGMVTGSTHVAVDCDGEVGLQEWADLVARNRWDEPTTTVKTGGGGRQVYFSPPSGVPLSNKVRFLPGLDFRGCNGMVVCPNSNHVSGGVYTFEEFGPLAPMPSFLLDILRQPQPKPTMSLASEVIPFHHRNDTVFRLVSSLRGKGAGEAELRERLTEINRTRCSPPLDGSALEWIIKSVMRYQPNKNGGNVTGENGMLLQALCCEFFHNTSWSMVERSVAMAIVFYSDAEGRISYATIGRKCGIGDNRTIEKAINSLTARGELLVYPSPKRGRGQTPPNAYKFTNPDYSFFLFHKPQLIPSTPHPTGKSGGISHHCQEESRGVQ